MSALNATADINAVINFVNQQILGGAAIAPEEFYSLQLLDTIRLDGDQYVYFSQADTMPIQNKADKLTLRRWSALQAHTVPLSEGVPPVSDKGSVKKYELEAFPYGRYMEFTDAVDYKVVDPIIAHFTKEYSLVAMETLDLLARDALLTVAQKHYASDVLGPDAVTFACVPVLNDLRKIILNMKKMLVKPRSSGKYLVIGSSEFYFDLFEDATVKQYLTINNNTYTLYDKVGHPLPDLFDMTFVETMCVPTSGEWVDGDGNKRLKYWIPGTTPALDVISTSDSATDADLDETDEDQFELVSGYVNDAQTGLPGSYIPLRPVWTLPAGAKEFKMQHILILGKEALARTGLAGQDSAKMYVKPLGSAGVLDPIDQRQSIGFKINSVGFGSTRPEAVVDYICVPTQVNI